MYLTPYFYCAVYGVRRSTATSTWHSSRTGGPGLFFPFPLSHALNRSRHTTNPTEIGFQLSLEVLAHLQTPEPAKPTTYLRVPAFPSHPPTVLGQPIRSEEAGQVSLPFLTCMQTCKQAGHRASSLSSSSSLQTSYRSVLRTLSINLPTRNHKLLPARPDRDGIQSGRVRSGGCLSVSAALVMWPS
jgi:hypothetical protein